MNIIDMKVNHIENPLGFEMKEVRLSYLVNEALGHKQVAARILVSEDNEFTTLVYDSGKINNVYDEVSGQFLSGIDSACFILPFAPKARAKYYWKVCVWTDCGEEVVSPVAWFETAKGLEEEWLADFIGPDTDTGFHPIIGRNITISKEIEQTRVYIIGLGIYELYVNGQKQGDEYLLPGFHAYDSWLQYQTFEVDLEQGSNTFEVMLGNGWYKGPFGLKLSKPRYGNEFGLIAEIHIKYVDGTNEIIGTDESWWRKNSNVKFDSIYDGEIIDDFTSKGDTIYQVKKVNISKKLLSPRVSKGIRIYERITPTLIKTPAGEWVLDMGQIISGWVEFNATVAKGATIKLQYGEILQQGNFYRENLRNAKCEFIYTSDGISKRVRPHFTYYGFRYVKVEGFKGEINPTDFTGCVLCSDMERTGWIETSDEKVNKLFENIVWGQKGNFLDVPTDCPQRDERMGWTGDAQVFCDTASFNMNTYAFYDKFMRDLAFEQTRCGGSVPYVVPMSAYDLHGASTWGDAATIIPWHTYVHFGDKTILKNQYDSMKAWVEYIKAQDDSTGKKRLWLTGKHFGDWLALDGKIDGGVYGRTDKYYIASAFYYYSTHILAKAGKLLGKEEAASYETLANEIKEAFMKEYFTNTGRLSINTQTAFAIAACMKLVPEFAKERFVADFRMKMQEDNFRLQTGFAATHYLLPALSESGHNDIAFDMLLGEDYPGWLYEVNQGATTVWERWNSVLPDGSMNPAGMNSLNHYAYGAVASWMYRYLCGIRPMETEPGFRAVEIYPYPNKRLVDTKVELKTMYGTYKVSTNYKDGKLKLDITIPFGCRAYVNPYLGIYGDRSDETIVLHTGTHNLVYDMYLEDKTWSLESDWREAIQDEVVKKVLEEYFPRAFGRIAFQNEMYTLGELVQSPFSEMSDEQIKRLEEQLIQIKKC